MYSSRRETRSDREIYLEGELDRYRAEEERRERERVEEREERRREFQERLSQERRSADSWPDALSKQSALFWGEYRYNPDPDETEDTDYFAQGAKACAAALELWQQEADKRQPEIDRHRAAIAALERDIRHMVALRLERQRQTSGWQQVVTALRDDSLDPSDWLNW